MYYVTTLEQKLNANRASSRHLISIGEVDGSTDEPNLIDYE